jgi:hypothetical protein
MRIAFNVSYMELWGKGYVGAIGAGPARHLPAYSWGSHVSPLIQMLRAGHQKVNLDPESLDRLITWIDLNGPYYPTTYCAYPNNPPGRSPLNRKELERLGNLAGFTSKEVTRTDQYKGPMISFDRPELSPCLTAVADNQPDRERALAIIREGARRLTERPRADMPGFVPWKKDLERRTHLEKYQKLELDSRRAIRERLATTQIAHDNDGVGAFVEDPVELLE